MYEAGRYFFNVSFTVLASLSRYGSWWRTNGEQDSNKSSRSSLKFRVKFMEFFSWCCSQRVSFKSAGFRIGLSLFSVFACESKSLDCFDSPEEVLVSLWISSSCSDVNFDSSRGLWSMDISFLTSSWCFEVVVFRETAAVSFGCLDSLSGLVRVSSLASMVDLADILEMKLVRRDSKPVDGSIVNSPSSFRLSNIA